MVQNPQPRKPNGLPGKRLIVIELGLGFLLCPRVSFVIGGFPPKLSIGSSEPLDLNTAFLPKTAALETLITVAF